jgi:hypothetical protein
LPGQERSFIPAGAFDRRVGEGWLPYPNRINIDAATSSLVTQAPPNDGILNTVGPLGVAVTGPVAFNIVADGEGNNAWLATGGTLYSVDLKSGKATMAGKIDGLSGTLSDIAWFD